MRGPNQRQWCLTFYAVGGDGGNRPIPLRRGLLPWRFILSTNARQASRRLSSSQVELARSFGVTWEEVGAALGVSRQAAWDRFASHERWQKSKRITQLRNARAAPRRQAAVLLKVRDQVDGSRAELHALQRWLDERPPRTQP
jgi:hypothetical protein